MCERTLRCLWLMAGGSWSSRRANAQEYAGIEAAEAVRDAAGMGACVPVGGARVRRRRPAMGENGMVWSLDADGGLVGHPHGRN